MSARAVKPPPAPPHLSDAARVEFDLVAGYLARKRTVSHEDAHALEVYATSVTLYRDAQRHLDSEGPVIDGAHGLKVKSPWLTVQNSAWDRVRPLLSMFGLTPADRARIKSPDAAKPGDDYFATKGAKP